MNDTADNASQQPTPLPEATVLAFARELRRLATQVERDLRRNEPVAALSALTAIKPLTGALSDAALSGVMSDGCDGDSIAERSEVSREQVNHNGYL